MPAALKRKLKDEVGSRKNRRVEDEEMNDADNFGSDAEMDDAGDFGEDEDEEMGSEEDEEEQGDVEGAWGGIEGDQAGTDGHEPGTKPKKPPTGEELRTIKDATDLFRSSSFKLQIDALLPNVRPKASRIPPLERFLLALHSVLTKIPSTSPQHPLEASRKLLKKGISVPYPLPLPTEETNWKVSFEKPSDITVVGSWPNKICVKAKDGVPFGVDVAVEMPNELFQEKDYLNGRFFHKRAFYLATVAAAIIHPKSGLKVDVLYESLSDDPRLTKLVLVPQKDGSQNDFTKLNARVCIVPILSQSSPIPLHRLAPSQSNLRVQSSSSDESTDATASARAPTPLYNTALLTSLLPRPQLLAIHSIKDEVPAFVDALTLLRIWANQRGYGAAAEGRTCARGFEDRGFWWSALLELAVRGEEKWGAAGKGKGNRRPLGRGLSSYQLFRAALDLLSKHEFGKEPIFVKTKDGQHRFSPEEYGELHEATFVDSSSLVNLLAGVPLGSLDLLRQDALKTLEALDHNSIHTDPFNEVFLQDHRDLPTRFDTVLHVNLSTAKPRNMPLHAVMDCGSPSNALLSTLSSILRKGLGDRTKAIAILHGPSTPRPLAQAHPSSLNTIYIGLIHDPTNAYRLVDHGPAADDEDNEKLEAFKSLWGPKSELRRFKDGRIVESVVWDVKTADERVQIPGMIVRHLLHHHFGIVSGSEAEQVKSWQKDFDSVLRLPESISGIYRESGVVTGVKGALNAFDDLVKKIKGLEEGAIPLSVLNVHPISEQLRYTSVFSPVPLPAKIAALLPENAKYQGPMEVLVEFEKSSRWPDDLKAIQKMKLAFLERLASELMSTTEGLTARVVVGDGRDLSEVRDRASLEIVNPDGWAFTVRIWVDREAVLLDRIIEEKNKKVPPMLKQKKKEEDQAKARLYREAYEAKELYTRRYIHSPRHHRAVANLSHQYSAYAGTLRLVKRWLASHWLLHGHISEEAVEILCAKFFVGDGKLVGVDMDSETDKEKAMRASIPGSKERGFATVVQFLKDWRWTEGVMVPMYGPQTKSLQEEDELHGVKSKDPGTPVGLGVWKLETEVDPEGHMWTRHGPDATVAQRVSALAKATWGLMQGMESGAFDVKAMFIHPTDDYDVVVRLDPGVLPRYFNNIAVDINALSRRGKYANVAAGSESVIRPGFDPASLLFNDLQRVYANTFKIFHDPFGGDRFGIVWDPSLREPRLFRVLGQFSSVPVKKESDKTKEKNLVTLNDAAILSEIERLGSGLVKEIAVQVAAQ